MSAVQSPQKAATYSQYPLSSVLLYNGVTFAHFLLGGIGIIYGFSASPVAIALGVLYLLFAFGQMYVIMPLTVCPNCLYYNAEFGRCTSGLNLLARKVARPGNPEHFARRAQGLLCHNNLYMAALFLPVLALIPALVLNFSVLLLATFAVIIGLLAYRFVVIFGTVACLHCKAKFDCPNAAMSGVRDK